MNKKQNNCATLLLITKSAYNNAKNSSIGHISFDLNCGYHFRVLFEVETNPHLKSCSTSKVAIERRELIENCCQNLFYVQKLQKKPIIKK